MCYIGYLLSHFIAFHVEMRAATIGFFPDVGTSHFAARMGSAGRYIAMTTTRLNAVDLVAAQLATHFVPSGQIPALQEALLRCPGDADVADVVSYCESVLSSFSRRPTSVHRQPFQSRDNVKDHHTGVSFLEEYGELIEHCFSGSETVADVQLIFGKFAVNLFDFLNGTLSIRHACAHVMHASMQHNTKAFWRFVLGVQALKLVWCCCSDRVEALVHSETPRCAGHCHCHLATLWNTRARWHTSKTKQQQ